MRSVPSRIAAYELGEKPSRGFSLRLVSAVDLAVELPNVMTGVVVDPAGYSLFDGEARYTQDQSNESKVLVIRKWGTNTPLNMWKH